MISREDRQRIKHISEALEKEVKIKEEGIKKLRETISKLSKYLYGQEAFECPLKLSNLDAICPTCTEVLPEVTSGWTGRGSTNFYNFPHGIKEEVVVKVRFKTEGCKEWRKKSHMAACGCGGIMWCECGYKEEYCVSDQEVCPYCGRRLQHEKYKMFPEFDLTQIGKATKLDKIGRNKK